MISSRGTYCCMTLHRKEQLGGYLTSSPGKLPGQVFSPCHDLLYRRRSTRKRGQRRDWKSHKRFKIYRS